MFDNDDDANEDSAMVRHSGSSAHVGDEEDLEEDDVVDGDEEDLEEDDVVDVVDLDEMESDRNSTNPSVRRRLRVIERFSSATRKLIYQIVQDEMEDFEQSLRTSEELVLDRLKRLQAWEQQLAIDSSQLSDREIAVSNRETIVTEREQQIAAGWEQMQAIKSGLAALLDGKSEPVANLAAEASSGGVARPL